MRCRSNVDVPTFLSRFCLDILARWSDRKVADECVFPPTIKFRAHCDERTSPFIRASRTELQLIYCFTFT